MNAEIFQKNRERNTRLLLIGILLFVGTILLVYLGMENEKKELPEPVSLNSLISEEKKDIDVYTYIDVNIEPYLFAVYEENGQEEDAKYYLAMDKNNYLYILYMNEEKLSEFKVDTIEENPIRVTGITKKIPSDIKELAISSYNELMEEEYLTQENFKDYIGYLYLDMETPINDSSLYYTGAFLTGLFFLLVFVTYIVIVIKNKKTMNEISPEEFAKIDAELSQMATSEYSNMKFYLLKDYIVDFNNNIVILKYEDILWAYPFEQRYNGLLINKYIKLTTKKNKVVGVASSKLLDKNKDEILQDILRKLKEKNKDIILGFNKENRKMVKEKLKEFKNQ